MWSVDRLAPPYAVCIRDDTGEVRNIPLAELPADLHEGDVLHHSPTGWQVQRQQAARRRASLSRKIKNLFT